MNTNRQNGLRGKTVLILSGPTREYLDPVRYLSNASSGKMGRALAAAARALGATVELVTGPVCKKNIPAGKNIRVHPVVSAGDMLDKARSLFPKADITLFAAAVADYRPAKMQPVKMTSGQKTLVLRLKPTPDIAAALGWKKKRGRITIGFALQTHDAVRQAWKKLHVKNLDAVILNTPEAIGKDKAVYRYITRHSYADWGRLSKTACARKILAEAVKIL